MRGHRSSRMTPAALHFRCPAHNAQHLLRIFFLQPRSAHASFTRGVRSAAMASKTCSRMRMVLCAAPRRGCCRSRLCRRGMSMCASRKSGAPAAKSPATTAAKARTLAAHRLLCFCALRRHAVGVAPLRGHRACACARWLRAPSLRAAALLCLRCTLCCFHRRFIGARHRGCLLYARCALRAAAPLSAALSSFLRARRRAPLYISAPYLAHRRTFRCRCRQAGRQLATRARNGIFSHVAIACRLRGMGILRICR